MVLRVNIKTREILDYKVEIRTEDYRTRSGRITHYVTMYSVGPGFKSARGQANLAEKFRSSNYLLKNAAFCLPLPFQFTFQNHLILDII